MSCPVERSVSDLSIIRELSVIPKRSTVLSTDISQYDVQYYGGVQVSCPVLPPTWIKGLTTDREL